MTITQQIEFVKELTANVTASLIKDIEASKTPESWTGMELRQLMADRYARSVYSFTTKSRKQEYNNTVLVNDL